MKTSLKALAAVIGGEPEMHPDDRERALKAGPHALVSTPEKREKLGRWLRDLIDDAINRREKVSDIWDEARRMYENENPGITVAPTDDMAPVGTPLLPTRCDALAARLCEIIRQDPIFSCENSFDDLTSSTQEEMVHRAAVGAGFNKKLGQVVPNAVLTNYGIWHLRLGLDASGFEQEGFGDVDQSEGGRITYFGPVIDSVNPDDFIIAPEVNNLEDATLLAHLVYESRWAVEEKQKLDPPIYFSDKKAAKLTEGDPDQGSESDSGMGEGFSDPSVEGIAEFHFTVRLAPEPGKLRRLFKGVLAYEDAEILSFDPYHDTEMPYIWSPLMGHALFQGFWNRRSVGGMMVPLQDRYNRDDTLFWNGSQAQAMPPIIGPEPLDEKFTAWKPGDYIAFDDANPSAKIFQATITFNGNSVRESMEATERISDQVARVSSNDTGSDNGRETTATEVNKIQQGAQAGLDDFAMRFTADFPKMARILIKMISLPTVWPHWALANGYDVDEDLETLKMPALWQANGQTSAATMGHRLLALQQIMQMANDPEYQLDKPAIAKQALKYSGFPGASRFLKVQNANDIQTPPQGLPPGTQPSAPGPQGVAAQPGVGAGGGLPIQPQLTQQGEALPPSPESTSRPGTGLPAAG